MPRVKRWVVLAFEVCGDSDPSEAADAAIDAVHAVCAEHIEVDAMVYAGHRDGPPEWIAGPVVGGRARDTTGAAREEGRDDG